MSDFFTQEDYEAAELYYYIDRCALWKRVAKSYRTRFHAMVSALRTGNLTCELWQERCSLAEAATDRLLELLRLLYESGILDPSKSMHDPGECEDCDLVREVEKELADDNMG